MTRVFANILTNAIEAITELGKQNQGVISISTIEDESGYLIITFKNSGPTIDESHFSQLFNSAFSSGKTKGSGLGLASCKKIVELHNGTIYAKNLPEKQGVIFTISLPIDASEDLVDSTKLGTNLLRPHFHREQGAHTASNALAGQLGLPIIQGLISPPIKILFLENEAIYRASLRNTIYSHPILKNLIILYDAERVEEALEILRCNKDISHAIVDIDLEDNLNGFDFLKLSKKLNPNLLTLIHTNHSFQDDDPKIKELDIQLVVKKPLSPLQLLRFLRGDKQEIGLDLETTENSSFPENVTTVLVIDDEDMFLENNISVIEEYFQKNQKKLKILKSTSYSESIKTIDREKGALDYILSDLNIDFSEDGLMLAGKVQSINENSDRKILFYIITNSNKDNYNQIISKDKVCQFFAQPLDLSSVHQIFQFSSVPFLGAPPHLNPNATPILKNIPVEDLSLFDITKLCNQGILNQISCIVNHDIIGELTLLEQNIGYFSEEQRRLKVAKIKDQISNFVDIVACVRLETEGRLSFTNFSLRRSLNQLLEEFEEKFYPSSNISIRVNVEEFEVFGDETLVQKAIYKILGKVFQRYATSQRHGSIEFNSSKPSTQKELLLTCDFFEEAANEDLWNSLFSNLPFSNKYFDLDYATASYLMNIQKHQIKIALNEINQTTTYRFIFFNIEQP